MAHTPQAGQESHLRARAGARPRRKGRVAAVRGALAGSLLVAVAGGCVTVGDFRREMKELEARLAKRQMAQGGAGVADLSARLDEVSAELRRLRGRIEVVEKTADEALAEARRARQELASRLAGAPEGGEGEAGSDAETGSGEPEEGAGAASTPDETPVSAALQAYREAYGAWREERHEECIDLFREFLKQHPDSDYADDAAFWMADCHFQRGDFKNAVLRFDDVVRNYPSGNKAPDALYRQGESLLRLGPGFHEAARRAFERVIREYPDSARAEEASRQIELLAAG